MSYRLTKSELMQWAADNYLVTEDSEGSPDQALMSGWVNAMDIQDECSGKMSDEQFLDYAYSEYENLGYHLPCNTMIIDK